MRAVPVEIGDGVLDATVVAGDVGVPVLSDRVVGLVLK